MQEKPVIPRQLLLELCGAIEIMDKILIPGWEGRKSILRGWPIFRADPVGDCQLFTIIEGRRIHLPSLLSLIPQEVLREAASALDEMPLPGVRADEPQSGRAN